MTRRVDISWKTVLFITAFLLALWVVYLILDIILVVFVAFILMSAIFPLVIRLERWRVPRPLAILIIFILIISIIGGILTVGFTPLINQTSSLSHELAGAVTTVIRSNYVDQSVIQEQASNVSRQLISYSFSALQNVISLISVMVITFYLLLEKERFEHRITTLFVGQQQKITDMIVMIENKLGAWLRGQLVLSVIIGVCVYVGLTLLSVPYALPLAIIAAIMEVVPVIGPIISAIPAVLIALATSPFLAGLVVGLYIAIQQVENHLVVPQVMRAAVGLNPLLVILSVSVGGRLLGVAGALLAVPIAVVIQVIVKEILKERE